MICLGSLAYKAEFPEPYLHGLHGHHVALGELFDRELVRLAGKHYFRHQKLRREDVCLALLPRIAAKVAVKQLRKRYGPVGEREVPELVSYGKPASNA